LEEEMQINSSVMFRITDSVTVTVDDSVFEFVEVKVTTDVRTVVVVVVVAVVVVVEVTVEVDSDDSVSETVTVTVPGQVVEGVEEVSRMEGMQKLTPASVYGRQVVWVWVKVAVEQDWEPDVVMVEVAVDVDVEREHVVGMGGAAPQTAKPEEMARQLPPGAHWLNLPPGQLTTPEKPVLGDAQYVPSARPEQNVPA
jgi:hypothetical protein